MKRTNSREQITILQKEGWKPDLVHDSKDLQLYNLKDPVSGDSLGVTQAWARRQRRRRLREGNG